MIPKFCPNCGNFNDLQIRYGTCPNEVYHQCRSCQLSFFITSEEEVRQMLNERIGGPCTWCGDPNHWRPDCPKIAEME